MFYSFEVYSLKASHSFSLSHSFPLRYMAHDNSSSWTFPTESDHIHLFYVPILYPNLMATSCYIPMIFQKDIANDFLKKTHDKTIWISHYTQRHIIFSDSENRLPSFFEICRVARTEVGKMCHFSSKNGCDLPPVKSYHLSCFPKCSVYSIFTYIWVIYGVNVGKYSMHGAYGFGFWQNQFNALCA